MPTKRKAKPILVLGAMPSEIKLIQSRLARPKLGSLAIYPYLRGRIGQLDVITAVTGVGVTNGAICAALFLHAFNPRALIVSGTGSRLNPTVHCGDVIVSKKTLHHAAG